MWAVGFKYFMQARLHACSWIPKKNLGQLAYECCTLACLPEPPNAFASIALIAALGVLAFASPIPPNRAAFPEWSDTAAVPHVASINAFQDCHFLGSKL
jgi:hypothetical protein